MSMTLMVAVWRAKVSNPLTKLVLLKLADNANDEGDCFPSYNLIADQCEISRRSAIAHIQKLRDMGIVTVQKRVTKNGNIGNLYRIDLGGESPAPPLVNLLHPPSESPAPPPSESPAPESVTLFNQSVNHTPLPPKGEKYAADVQEVFDHWRAMLGHPRAKLDKKRQSRIIARLKEGYCVDDLKLAINGISHSAYHMGDNKEKTVYDGIHVVFRDAEQLERFKTSYEKFIEELPA